MGGATYFVTFVDDASRKVWVHAMKHKDEVLHALKQFHVKDEKKDRKEVEMHCNRQWWRI